MHVKNLNDVALVFLMILTFSQIAYANVTRELYQCEKLENPDFLEPQTKLLRIPNSGEVVNLGKVWRTLRLSYISDLQRQVVHSYEGLVPKQAKVIVVALHGYGSSKSRSGSMVRLLSDMNPPRALTSNGFVENIQSDFHTVVSNEKNFARIAAIAFDLPGAQPNKDFKKITSFQTVVEDIAKVVSYLKTTFHLPIIVVAKSASAAFAVKAWKRENFDALFLIGPTFPSTFAISQSLKLFDKPVYDGGLKPEWDIINWVADLLLKIELHDPLKQLPPIPVTLVVGDKDKETTPEMIESWTKTFTDPSKHTLLRIPRAKHDPFMRTSELYKEDDPEIIAVRALYEFAFHAIPQ